MHLFKIIFKLGICMSNIITSLLNNLHLCITQTSRVPDLELQKVLDVFTIALYSACGLPSRLVCPELTIEFFFVITQI